MRKNLRGFQFYKIVIIYYNIKIIEVFLDQDTEFLYTRTVPTRPQHMPVHQDPFLPHTKKCLALVGRVD